MRSIRARLGFAERDAGMTLVEVMVAMFVFAILSTVVLSTLIQVIGVNRASQAQHVAANLAASEVDLAHDWPDLFTLMDDSRAQVVNGMSFQIQRDTEWVSDTSSEAACGAGGGNLRFKRVNVTVTWDGMPDRMQPVRADTVVDPVERLNDPAKGTILVSVIDASGVGVAGVTVTVTATSTGAPVPSTTTDAQGCAYFLQVTRGIYKVAIAKSDYIGVALEPSPEKRDVSIQPGTTSSIGFQYDRRATLNATVAGGQTGVRLPNNLPLTFISTYGVATQPLTSTAGLTTTSATRFRISVHPRVTYRLLAGNYGRDTGAECTAPDPTAWPEATDIGLAEGRAPELSADPTSTVTLDIPMGLVRIDSTANALQATPAAGATGDPACGATLAHSFGNVAGGTTIALPYGSWRLTSTSGPVVATVTSRGTYLLGVARLDPRQAP